MQTSSYLGYFYYLCLTIYVWIFMKGRWNENCYFADGYCLGDAEANRRNLTELIGSYEGVDLFVLPEMFATGFGFPPQQVAEPEVGGPTLEWMRRMAQEGNCAVAGSVAVRTASDTFRNRFYFVFPDGNVEYYDKRHLFAFGVNTWSILRATAG